MGCTRARRDDARLHCTSRLVTLQRRIRDAERTKEIFRQSIDGRCNTIGASAAELAGTCTCMRTAQWAKSLSGLAYVRQQVNHFAQGQFPCRIVSADRLALNRPIEWLA
jgi:hypothetical protein